LTIWIPVWIKNDQGIEDTATIGTIDAELLLILTTILSTMLGVKSYSPMQISLHSFMKSVMLLMISTLSLSSHAGDRLLATGGATQIEGAAGGGLVPWALISGYGTRDQVGGAAFYSHVRTQGDFDLQSAGGSIGFNNRVEISYSHLRFGLGDTVPGERIRMNVLGAKLRLFGDAIYDQDTWKPQVSAGLQFKQNEDFDFVPKALGAKHDSGVDAYLAATKLFMGAVAGRNLLLNLTLQATKANQFGILGFGGDQNDSYRLQPAFSSALMLTDDLLMGVEYRAKPNNLGSFREDNAKDIFLAWFPTKRLALTGAYVDLGNIANKDDQRGWYLSGQVSF
jgi:hypothetical protein